MIKLFDVCADLRDDYGTTFARDGRPMKNSELLRTLAHDTDPSRQGDREGVIVYMSKTEYEELQRNKGF